MKYIKRFEFKEDPNEIYGKYQYNVSIDKLTDDSKDTLYKIFKTLNIPYDINVINQLSYEWGRVVGATQHVVIKNVHIEIIKKILNISSLYYDSFDFFKGVYKIDIIFSVGDHYSKNYFGFDLRDNNDSLIVSVGQANFIDNKWKLNPNFRFVKNDKNILEPSDLEKYQIERDTNKYNL